MVTWTRPSFTPGDHLRVWRRVGPAGYYHHGIYIDDDQVIQFGGRICDKRHASVGAVPLPTFENGDSARLVSHGGRTWWGAPRFPSVAREVTVRRAQRLVHTHPDGLYDLFGYNCEHAANFCSTNSYESYQVRGYFAIRSLVGVPATLWFTAHRHEHWPRSRLSKAALAAWLTSGSVGTALYYVSGERFMRRVGRPLLEWERSQPT